MHRSRRPRPLPSTGAKRDAVQTARVFKSGNSLAVRIPGGIAKQLDIREGIGMEISLDDGRIWLRRVRELPTLQELVDSIDPNDAHDEQFPNLVGRERW